MTLRSPLARRPAFERGVRREIFAKAIKHRPGIRTDNQALGAQLSGGHSEHRPNSFNALRRPELRVHGLGCRVPNGESPTTPDFAWL